MQQAYSYPDYASEVHLDSDHDVPLLSVLILSSLSQHCQRRLNNTTPTGLMFSLGNPFPHLRKSYKHNVETFKTDPLAELSGSLGDLGTLLPLMTALVITRSISLPATLLFTGAANILTGAAFGIPLPVQPMKAIAAVAIARKFTLEENAAAGIVVSHFSRGACIISMPCMHGNLTEARSHLWSAS